MNVKKPKTTKIYKALGEIFCDLALMLRPPERLSVADAAEKYRYINQPGAYVGKWQNSTVMYMVEPMNTFTSRTYTGMIFVGPAQSGKTDALVLNTLAYSIKVDPMDMIVYCPGMIEARDFGIRRIDRLHRHSVEIGQMLLPQADADNRFDKQYTTGMLFTISWPTPATLAGKPVGRIVITDRDRMDDNIAGDGEPFDLASKRTTTFGSYAMTVAESSPSREISNPKWIPQSPHEAPPCEGILKLYNRGDRRRWYWPCPHCGEHFEGMFKHLTWDTTTEGLTNLDRAATTRMLCPISGCVIHPDDRDEMNFWGTWVKDGQGVDSEGKVFGPEPRTSIASFWLRGVAASFITWTKLVDQYLNANDEYVRTGSEEALRKFYNNDLGEPYVPRSQAELRLPEVLKARAEKMAERKVPAGVRFLIATVDVQKNMFVVSVFGILPGMKFDMVVVDRYEIRKSKRTDHDGERLWVKPSTYVEDWDELIEHVIDKEYELDDDTGRQMGIRFVGCDSGGRAGVTSMAYSFYRRLREQNKHRRFILLKGDASPNQPRTRISFPDSQRKDMLSAARGDIPVLLIQSNLVKDDLDGRLDCLEPGKGMYRYPDWLSDSFFSELCVETRTEKGWENLSNQRNEQWDLSYYAIGLCVSELIRAEHIKWQEPPGWAAEWEKNDLVRQVEQAPRFANTLQSVYDFSEFGKALASST
jgi:phage terminase large subunit GpA-like protein